jgi:hypothetical protein
MPPAQRDSLLREAGVAASEGRWLDCSVAAGKLAEMAGDDHRPLQL